MRLKKHFISLFIFLFIAIFCTTAYSSSLDELLNDISKQIVDSFARAEGKVLEAKGGEIYISLGQKDGIQEDEIVEIISSGELIKDPDTGDILGEVEGEAFKSKIKKVYPHYSVCVPNKSEDSAKKNDSVKRKLDQLYILLLPTKIINRKVKTDIESAILNGIETRLVETTQIQIVERNRINASVKELEFQQSGLTSLDSIKKLGKMVNADLVLTTKLKLVSS